MAGITLIFSALDRNLVFSFGVDVQKDDDDEKEVQIVESSGDIQLAMGFQPNRTEETEEDEDARSVFVSQRNVLH